MLQQKGSLVKWVQMIPVNKVMYGKSIVPDYNIIMDFFPYLKNICGKRVAGSC